jgi:hypothetical protein
MNEKRSNGSSGFDYTLGGGGRVVRATCRAGGTTLYVSTSERWRDVKRNHERVCAAVKKKSGDTNGTT